ncbi:MAG: hypothetical protein Q8M11_20800, partial [Sulfuritalea sp.]|nr:hypothetical protein [Sulfuritalea sp.]
VEVSFVMLVYPHEILHNHSLGIEGMKVQDNSWCRSKPLLRVAASSNMAVDLAPFGRWTLRDEAAQRRSP